MTDLDLEPLPQPRTSRRIWPVLTASALVAAIALAVLWRAEASDSSDLADERDDRRQVEQVAAAFGEAYLSYDFGDVDASGDAVVALATEDFAEDFAETRAPGIEEVFADLETTTHATTKEVFVGSVGKRSARALVVVDVRASNTSTGDQVLTNLSFVLDLVREDGEWRVNAVAPSPQPDIAGDEAEAPATGEEPEVQP